MSPPEDELGRLLDECGPAADAATLDGIVRRHRLRKARRLKQMTAASIVVALAAGGVALSGVNRSPAKVDAIRPVGAKGRNAVQKKAPGPVAASPAKGLRTVPDKPLKAVAGSPAKGAPSKLGSAPSGLSWATAGASGAAAPSSSPAAFASPATTVNPPSSPGAAIAGGDLCTVYGCGASDGLGPLQHLFDRTGGGVTIRAFTESEQPIVFLPLAPAEQVPEPTSGGDAVPVPGDTNTTSTSPAAATTTTAPPTTSATAPLTTTPSTTTTAPGTPSTTAPLTTAPSTTTTAPGTTSTTAPSTTAPSTTSTAPSTSTTAPGTTSTTAPLTTAPSTTTTAPPGTTSTTAPSTTSTAPPGSCETGAELVAEVSDAGAVAEIDVPLGSSNSSAASIGLLEASVVGTRESAPMVVVVVHVSASVDDVQASFADGTTDSMVPSSGWAVLADAVADSTTLSDEGEQVTLTATGAGGSTLETTNVAGEPAYAVPASCVYPDTVEPMTAAGAGSASSSGN